MDDKRLDRLEAKIDKIIDKLEVHSKILARHSTLHEKNTEDLEDHIKRTNLLEDSLRPLKQTDTILRAVVKGVGTILAILTILKLLGIL